jgi:hypothetical protein
MRQPDSWSGDPREAQGRATRRWRISAPAFRVDHGSAPNPAGFEGRPFKPTSTRGDFGAAISYRSLTSATNGPETLVRRSYDGMHPDPCVRQP